MYLLYDVLIVCATVISLPIVALRNITRKGATYGLRERFGMYRRELFEVLREQPRVWIHAASVGETQVALLLARKIRENYPDHAIVLTHQTKTGLQLSRDSDWVDCSLLFPVDLSYLIRRLLARIKPDLVVMIETEIWPNLTRLVHQAGTPMLLVNGRISDTSYPRYRLIRLLLKPILRRFTALCMQSQSDAERIVSLGADSDRVENTGNLKFDYQVTDETPATDATSKAQFGIPEEHAILVAGSTHEGEEQELLSAYRDILAQVVRPLSLILIPRYPDRAPALARLLDDMDIPYRIRSELNKADSALPTGSVLLVDTLGEVSSFYRLADVVFVGGSLVPVGGHNLLEATLLGKPVLFGPYVANVKEIAQKLVRAGAGIRLNNRSDLIHKSIALLNDAARCQAMGQAGQVLITENTGATERTLKHVRHALQ